MKKKLISMMLTAVMAASLLAGCAAKEEAAPEAEDNSAQAAEEQTQEPAEEEESSEEKTTFTVGFDAEYPPYGYMDENGEYTGFDLELAQAVCDLEGWELVKTPIAWDSKDMELESGTIDCIWNGFTMNGREDDYTWSDPYVDNCQAMVVAENSGIETFDDLAGKVVGVQAASAALQLLQDEEGQKELADTFGALQEFADYNSAFVELQAGSVQAVAMDIGVAQYQIKTRGEGFKIMDEKLNSEKYAIGFKLGNEELRDKVNADLQTLLEDGTFDELAEKYELSDMVCLEAK